MSRSRRHTPITGVTTSSSEKRDKQKWHRRFRKANKEALMKGEEPIHYKEVSDEWSMGKDGKLWFGNQSKFLWDEVTVVNMINKWMRK